MRAICPGCKRELPEALLGDAVCPSCGAKAAAPTVEVTVPSPRRAGARPAVDRPEPVGASAKGAEAPGPAPRPGAMAPRPEPRW